MAQEGRASGASKRRAGGEDGLAPGLDQLRHDLLEELRRLEHRIDSAQGHANEPRVQRHLRRYLPFYALAATWALVVALVPSRAREVVGPEVAVPAAQTTQAQAMPIDGAPSDQPGSQVVGGPTSGGGPTNAAKRTGESPKVPVSIPKAEGVTRGGFPCKEGVRQLPWSQYAAPCVPKFSGDNRGATHRGVTKDAIKIARRVFTDPGQFDAFAQMAGVASQDVAEQVRDIFIDYFNKSFELYGRKVVFEEYTANPQANSTEEAQGRGKEGACIDATYVVQEMKAFAQTTGSIPFAECAGERKLTVFSGGAYYPETWMRKYHPYLLMGPGLMECERIALQGAEYVGKQLWNRPAKWAKDPLLHNQTRKTGIWVPSNDGYQECTNLSEKVGKEKYGTYFTSRYNYTLDVSRMPDEAARGIIQFKAAGVTTILIYADPYSVLFLTQHAKSQQYLPEWMVGGTGVVDTDSSARLFDQDVVENALFGMSQLAAQWKLWGPKGEPGITYQKVTGKEIPMGTTGDYYALLQIFSFLQAAGPELTPDSMDRAIHALPPGGYPDYGAGGVSFNVGSDGTPGAGDHSPVDDARQVYWCRRCISKMDGKEGTYVEAYGGKRFTNGQFPTEEPRVYPPGS